MYDPEVGKATAAAWAHLFKVAPNEAKLVSMNVAEVLKRASRTLANDAKEMLDGSEALTEFIKKHTEGVTQ